MTRNKLPTKKHSERRIASKNKIFGQQDCDRFGRARVRTLMETNSTHWHGTEGDADYLNTWGTKGNRWKHFGNQGRQSDTWHRRKGKIPETRGKLIFQNKTGNDETKHDSKLKVSTRPDNKCHKTSCSWMWELL